ncbi:MAG: hypothetical protein E6Q97_12675 [Desulfurellales bacterium]|nr:MAG: hypothetical protein E6Q97_12675 [Desulfurellales bacterium]
MANLLYPKGKEALLQSLDLSSVTVKAVLVDAADYTYSSSHDFLDDVPSGARVGTPQTLSNKTFTDGVFNADDITFTAVTGDVCEALVIYNDTPGAESGKHLIAYIDTATGLPVTPNGGNINVAWDTGANKIFAL